MSNFDKYVLAFFPPIYASGQFKDYRVLEKLSISDTLLDENDESLVFVTIWDCCTYVRVDRFGFQNFCSPGADPDQTATLFAIPSASFGLLTLW